MIEITDHSTYEDATTTYTSMVVQSGEDTYEFTKCTSTSTYWKISAIPSIGMEQQEVFSWQFQNLTQAKSIITNQTILDMIDFIQQ